MKNIKQIAADIVHALQGLCHLPSWWAQRLHKRDPYLWTFGAWDGTRPTIEHPPTLERVKSFPSRGRGTALAVDEVRDSSKRPIFAVTP